MLCYATKVTSVEFDPVANTWLVSTDDGGRVTCRWVVLATGCLSAYNKPKIEGLDSFQGRTLTTHDFPRGGVDFSGRRVALIGTGSSAVQTSLAVAPQAAELAVFQRTPTYVVPAADATRGVPSSPQARVRIG